MSVDKERYEARRWLGTAEEDLDAARSLLDSGKFSHSCFFSQQAGEKAVKALWYLLGEDPWGHSIQKLIAELPDPVAIGRLQPHLQDGAQLDRYYIPTRYPNGLPDLTPGQAYFRRDAELCIEASRRLLTTVAGFVNQFGQ
ncbi:MAG: HEPN domain-containing protein [Acidobacteria bacterium]|nr:HEPN domain-containing protein [Acidobacteriota bacterium]